MPCFAPPCLAVPLPCFFIKGVAFCCGLISLLAGGPAVSQTTFPVRFESLGINNGLSQGFISGITQDHKGFMWFTTSDGLNKYDGYHFTIFRHDPEDTNSIGSDDLTAILEDSKGRLWIGTHHNGLDLFDHESNRFSHFREGDPDGLRSNNIMGITEDKAGNLWIRTEQGIDCAEASTRAPPARTAGEARPVVSLRFTHIRLDNASEAVRYKFDPAKVFADSRNHVYLTTNSRVWEASYRKGSFTYSIRERFAFPVIDSSQIADMLEDTTNHSLLLNCRQVYRFAGYNFDSARMIFRPVRAQTPWTIDHRQRIWLTDSNRISLLLPSGVQVASILEPDIMQALRTSTVLYTDRTGVVWIGTGGYGILKYDPEKESFHHILTGFTTYQMQESSPGKVISVGVHDAYAVSIRKNIPVQVKRLIEPALLKKNSAAISMGSFTVDTTGNYWLGVNGRLIRYSPGTRQFRTVPMPPTEKTTQPFPMYTDGRNNLWMGYNRYFVRYETATGHFTKWAYPERQQSYEYDFLQCIYEEGNLLWLGSVNGLFRFDAATGEMLHYMATADPASLSSNFILSINNDRRQPGRYLWIGTKGGGLNRMDKQTGRFIRYSTKDGLPNNVVYGILPDERDNLWLSTNKGLSQFNPFTIRFRNFDVSYGLQSNEFNRYAYCRTREGLLAFGGMNGINYFDPDDIHPLQPPEVVLTDFRLFNKTVGLNKAGSPLQNDISFTGKISVQYSQNVITFQFAAMDYRNTGNARYRYRMDGFDKDWIYSGTLHEATYTNLDPGTYIFRVESSFSEDAWSSRPAFVEIRVIPPWWGTWWFFGGIGFAATCMLYVFYRYRVNQLLKLERVRNRIARDLHDEVGSSISTIAIYSKVIQEQLGSSSANSAPLLGKIIENVQEIMEAMNDIVWNINTKNDAFDRIVSRMREHAYQLFEVKGYQLHFYFDENLSRIKLGMEKRRDFYLIYKEALNNIAKYAEGKNVWISLLTHNSGLRLTIRDDGKGFDLAGIRKNSNGLINMQHRTRTLKGKISIVSSPGRGTEIILSF